MPFEEEDFIRGPYVQLENSTMTHLLCETQCTATDAFFNELLATWGGSVKGPEVVVTRKKIPNPIYLGGELEAFKKYQINTALQAPPHIASYCKKQDLVQAARQWRIELDKAP